MLFEAVVHYTGKSYVSGRGPYLTLTYARYHPLAERVRSLVGASSELGAVLELEVSTLLTMAILTMAILTMAILTTSTYREAARDELQRLLAWLGSWLGLGLGLG